MLFSLGVIRGLIFGVVGAAAAIGLTILARTTMGITAWNPGTVSMIGTIVGIIFFFIGLGAFDYWLRWITGRTEAGTIKRPLPQWTRYFGFATNHKIIGIQYMVTSLLVILVAGVFQLIDRLETAQPGLQIMTPTTYNSLMSLHGIMMLGAVLIGISGMMNYLIPLMIGAKDMAFPHLNALSYWVIPPAVSLLLISLPAGGFDTGWTAYPPLSVKAPLGMQFMLLAFYIVGLSSILGGINFVTTILKMRAPGMGLFRMPIFIWTALATAILQLIFTQFVGVAFLMIILERLFGLTFFTPGVGNVLLFQHLFWFYSHPAVYIFILPGLGVISEILPVFSRKPLFGYQAVALSSLGIAGGGVIVWGHHMFVSGMASWLRMPFMFTTMLVAVPTGVKIFSWLATMWMGKIYLQTPMLFTMTAITVFLIGGITGVPNGIVPVDLYIHDTYWVVGHFHATLFGGFLFPAMAAFYFWFPKVTGRHMGEGLGRVHWGLMTTGFFTTYMPMFWLGLNGMRRRIADYDPALGLGNMNMVVTIGGYIIGISILLFVINLIVSLRRGETVSFNPWRSMTLEWQVSSPPPEENFTTTPVVVGSPYGYGIPNTVHVIFSSQAKDGHEDT